MRVESYTRGIGLTVALALLLSGTASASAGAVKIGDISSSSSSSGGGGSSSTARMRYFDAHTGEPASKRTGISLLDDRSNNGRSTSSIAAGTAPGDPGQCFNCLLPSYTCMQYGKCNEYNGQCICPDGFGGLDCSQPLDGSLADGRERYPREGSESHCKPGWSGLTCNVCETDDACRPLVPHDDSTIRPHGYFSSSTAGTSHFFGGDKGQGNDGDGAGDGQQANPAVCYKGGYAVKTVQQMCDVTNRKILDMLPDRPPQVTFACDRSDSTCGFQFWVGGIQSFYCGLEQCEIKGEATYNANVTKYDCQTIKCSCIPGRMLCGEEGSINIDDFLSEEIKGPGSFSCKSDGSGCLFTEPAMNQLINDVFGDEYITLKCNSGECLHYTMVPGFERPARPDNTRLVAASISVAAVAVIVACILFWYLGRQRKYSDFGRITLGADDDDADGVGKMMANHVPARLQFKDVSYRPPNGKVVLSDVAGAVAPGQLLAIMGASGAGKSTLLDILARKTKRGSVSGEILVNGRELDASTFKRIVGFVDQEDTLMSTLTVYETVLYSALLRLPREMSYEAKRIRTLETMHELGILGIKDARIGESGKRSVSGGEKRRVSIACELVTSPSILFLDEPTSGLDAFNAVNVVECLVNLARDYNRTVVFTIHQPRSNIVAMFDHLLLLAGGKVVYSGNYARCQGYFDSIGHACPPGFNIADFLIDLTMQDERESSSRDDVDRAVRGDEESATTGQSPRTPTFANDTELSRRRGVRSLASRSTDSPRKGASSPVADTQERQHLARLVEAYQKSEIASGIKDGHGAGPAGQNGGGQHEALAAIATFRRASWWTQFTILSGRSFRNLYRNPMLMLSHYAVSILVGLMCSFLFAHVTDDIPGFQNRMGLFFFILAVFGFSCLTSLDVFAKERILFMRERSNGYYSPFTYFTAKVLFDILPLRVIPPFILGAIIYSPVGLVAELATFWKFILVLILFNLSASSVVFFISIVISNSGVANLVGSLVMLFNLLFAGLLINREKVPLGVGWVQTLSFFHAAFEALLVNELRYLQLRDHKYGVDIEVPAATILSLFGFRAQAFWWPDFAVLCIYFGGFIVLSFLALVFLVKERR